MTGAGSVRKPRKRLATSEKYEIFIQVLTQQATQREAAERFGVDRSTVVSAESVNLFEAPSRRIY